jgi:ABC-type branched-subunit amino acid transport system substrate-binding protein
MQPNRAKALTLHTIFWLSLTCFLGGCRGSVQPVVKLGLVVPFEGLYREMGYEVLQGVRLAVRQANEQGGTVGYQVEVVAYDDGAWQMRATEQAERLVIDPQVLAVLGNWLPETTTAAAQVYAKTAMPFIATSWGTLPTVPTQFRLAPDLAYFEHAAQTFAQQHQLNDLYFCDCDFAAARRHGFTQPTIGLPTWELGQFYLYSAPEGGYFITAAPRPGESETSAEFAGHIFAMSGGIKATSAGMLAYDATRVFLAALARATQSSGQPTRATLASALAQTDLDGLIGPIRFDAAGNWQSPNIRIYQWRNGLVETP